MQINMLKIIYRVVILSFALIWLISCTHKELGKDKIKTATYKIAKAKTSFNFDDDWDAGEWAQTNALELTNYMGSKPEHFPKTQVKMLYDSNSIYLFFRIKDKYVRSIANAHQGNVWRDSCVEFFFTPGEDISEGYFNIEANCGGFILFQHQRIGGEGRQMIDSDDINNMMIMHSMPTIINTEITEPTTWTLKYTIPFVMLEKYASLKKPDHGIKWRANFYKCAGGTSHPHWLTWSVVENPIPNFHLPNYFGTLEFD
jgi:hypothetical protein